MFFSSPIFLLHLMHACSYIYTCPSFFLQVVSLTKLPCRGGPSSGTGARLRRSTGPGIGMGKSNGRWGYNMIEGSLEVKLPTIWTDGKAEVGRVREAKRREEERRSEKRKSQKKEDAGVRKGRKVAKHYVFPMFLRSGGSKSRLAKAAGVEPSGHMRDDKLRAAVARSTFRSQNVQSTSCSEHFWKLRCRKSSHRCGAKHISL